MFLPVVLLVCVSILSYVAIIQSWSLRQTDVPLAAGEVASQDVRAPYALQYISQVRTEQARLEAERTVAPVYNPPDAVIGRGQVDALNSILAALTAIRDDPVASPEDKRLQMSALPDISLQPASIEFILAISPARWDSIQEASRVLLAEVMRAPVRAEDLETVRAGLPSLVSLNLTENEAAVTVELVAPLVAANTFYSAELTGAARQAARDAVQPVLQSYASGQTIVSRGQVVSGVDFEALMEFGLVKPPSRALDYAGAAALVVISAIFTAMYFHRRQSSYLQDLRSLILLSLLFLLFLFVARIVLPDRAVLPYVYPLAAFGLLVSALFGMESGLVFSLIIAALAAYAMPASLGLMPYYILSSLCGVLAVGRARRVTSFLYAAAAIAGAGAAMVIAYRFTVIGTNLIDASTLAGATVFYGLASTSVALLLQYGLAQFLGLTTPMQLLEISRPDAPLLRYFLQRAPGTYQHSLQVANLAEQAAERIGADGLLTRVGALFHDVGKTANPLFFVENQPANQINSHDDMDPAESAETIIRHVTDGLKLAKKYRLPRRIHDFILEHHGTLITRYQYNRAVQAAEGDASKVDAARFRYPGPAPHSRETAILMLADGVEARARADRPQDDEAMRIIVRALIERSQKENQFEQAPLTQRDLRDITESFVTTLRTTYHPRLEYPPDLPAARDIPTVHRKPK
jgi:putative nucleotidyltransferase with HDIG domain